jgi:hypothetical protein
MKLYSDVLSASDLIDLDCVVSGVSIYAIDPLPNTRVRKNGFKIVLTGTSPFGRNTGRWGAAGRYEQGPPATWDEHGAWMAQVFEKDPKARIAYYDGRDDFHKQTHSKYMVKV